MKTYFTGDYSARRPLAIVVGVLLAAIGTWLVAGFAPQFIHMPLDSGHIAIIIMALLLFGGFFGMGVWLLTQALKNKKTVLMITSVGVSYGAKSYRWDDVIEIGIMQKYTRRRDLYCTARSSPFVIELLLTYGLRPEQIKVVEEALRREVIPLHPHVRLVNMLGDVADG